MTTSTPKIDPTEQKRVRTAISRMWNTMCREKWISYDEMLDWLEHNLPGYGFYGPCTQDPAAYENSPTDEEMLEKIRSINSTLDKL